MSQFIDSFDTPVGRLTAISNGVALAELRFTSDPAASQRDRVIDQIEAELAAYFAGELLTFSTRLAPSGTPFQQRVWQELLKIDCGATRSYAAIAKSIGAPAAVRAVGTANGANPIAIVIPCHRVVRTGGALGGYAGGLDRKRWLLDHERQMAGATLFA